MDRLNVLWDRFRGLVGLGGWLMALMVSTAALASASGWGPLPTPATRLQAIDSTARIAHVRIDALSQTLDVHMAESSMSHADIERMLLALKVDLCLRHPDAATRARMQLDCSTILRGRP